MCGIIMIDKNSASLKTFEKCLETIKDRGPDQENYFEFAGKYFGFERLAIMDLSLNGMQPFIYDDCIAVCNGEIYNYPNLKTKLASHPFNSSSDCEILIPLYLKYGIEIMVKMLDAEFAFILYDNKKQELFAARDPLGIRPLFYGYDRNNNICFASEAKALISICDKVYPFPCGHYYYQNKFICYNDISNVSLYHNDDLEQISNNIKIKLEQAVIKRLQSDAPIGFLLSGGLDSSLVCSIAQKHLDHKIKTFAIGMKEDAIDLKYAREVAKYLGTDHVEVVIDQKQVIDALNKVIYALESFDITTIRASIGMYLLCQYIHEHTDLKVILTGEVSDELFGYKYTDFAPNAFEFQKESEKRIKELYMYDVLRADRCISSNSLEGRVPFADLDFVHYVLSIDPFKKMNHYNKGKYLLRKAFDEQNYLPKHILYREKAAFSDAVGHSLVNYLIEYASSLYSDQDLANAVNKYPDCTPFTKESLLYRDIFESFYPGQAHLIKDFWMPNKHWDNCNVNDPSARVLSNYGESGK